MQAKFAGMTVKPTKFTRRQAACLVLGGPVAAPVLLGPLGAAACTTPCYEQEFRALLGAIRLPYQPAQLALQNFAQTVQNSETVIEAVVRLTWAPGMRTRLFIERDRDPEWAYAKLAGRVEGYFLSLS